MLCCTFIGHRFCERLNKKRLRYEIENLIKKSVTTFFVGTQGAFDKIVYEVLSELENEYEINIIVVLAYLNRNRHVYYDIEKSIFPDCLTKTPVRFAISRRNDYMLKNSQYVICYLDDPFSNTANFVIKAKRQNKRIINIGDFEISRISIE